MQKESILDDTYMEVTNNVRKKGKWLGNVYWIIYVVLNKWDQRWELKSYDWTWKLNFKDSGKVMKTQCCFVFLTLYITLTSYLEETRNISQFEMFLYIHICEDVGIGKVGTLTYLIAYKEMQFS